MPDNLKYKNNGTFTGDGNSFIDEGNGFENNDDARLNISTIVINNIFIPGQGRYGNGDFVAAFCEPLGMIAQCSEFHGSDLRLLLYLMSKLTRQLCFSSVTFQEIQTNLHMSESTARRTVKNLIRCNILCQSTDAGKLYRLSDKLINPRVAVHGNTKKVNKKDMPILYAPDGEELIPRPNFNLIDWHTDEFDAETGEIFEQFEQD